MHEQIQADRVLVAGATGHLGRHLVAELHERGCWVRVLIRRAEQATALSLADEVFVGQARRHPPSRGQDPTRDANTRPDQRELDESVSRHGGRH